MNRIRELWVAAVALGVVVATTGVTPAAAQQEKDSLKRQSRVQEIWGWGWWGEESFPEPGFGSVRARVHFDEANERFQVEVDRVGLDCCIIPVPYRTYYLSRSHRADEREPWWSGLGLFEAEGSSPGASPRAPPDTTY